MRKSNIVVHNLYTFYSASVLEQARSKDVGDDLYVSWNLYCKREERSNVFIAGYFKL
jgi:hypothetical protein